MLLKGGSYKIESPGSIVPVQIIKYNEVVILIDKQIGSGLFGDVYGGKIIECKINSKLNFKNIAIKKFKDSSKKPLEKDNLLTYNLDKDNELIEIINVPSLYFDINTGPLAGSLIYEYGGDILTNYFTSSCYSLINNKKILIDLFITLKILTDDHDNMHNDFKCDNIVFYCDDDGKVNIKIIDYGESLHISQLEKRQVAFNSRTNMNTPETIYNFLHYKCGKQEPYSDYYNFSKWYYYPIISIMFFLFTGNQYSTGSFDNHIIKKVLGYPEKISAKYQCEFKENVLKYLLDNNNIKKHLEQLIKPDMVYLLPKLFNIIDKVCINEPSKRIHYVRVIDLFNSL